MKRLWVVLAVVSSCGVETVADVREGADVEVATDKTEFGPLTYRLTRGEAEKIVGTDEKVVVGASGENLAARYRPLIDAFGQTAVGCTATHIGGGIVLTAGHCVNAPATRVFNQPCNDTVKWGYRQNADVYLTSTCTKMLAMEFNQWRDFAIFEVTPAPTAFVPVAITRPQIDRSISIFGHPNWRPLEWSPAGSLSSPPCVVVRNEFDNGDDMFKHQCDTEPGNSGSAIIDDVTLKVIGIHNGGAAPWNYATALTATPLASLLNFDGGVVVQPDAGTPNTGTVDAGVSGGVDAGVPAATPLSSGVPVSGLAGATNSQTVFSVWVPEGTPSLVVKLQGTNGDADLYVRRGQVPTSGNYDCRPFTSTSTETCTFLSPRSGWWYVMIQGFSAYASASVTAFVGNSGGVDGGTIVDGGSPATDGGVGQVLVRGAPVTMLGGAIGSNDIWRVELPTGASQLTVSTSGGTGDVDIYVSAGQAPTTTTYQCASRSTSNRETCTVNNPSAGSWFVLLRGYSSYSGVTLRAD